jgi:pre-mRNA-splicing factor CWC22
MEERKSAVADEIESKSNDNLKRKSSSKSDRHKSKNEDSKDKGENGKKEDAPLLGSKKTVADIGRSGGVYIPPFKLAELAKGLQDKSSVEYQKMTWEALKKSVNGLINKVCDQI